VTDHGHEGVVAGIGRHRQRPLVENLGLGETTVYLHVAAKL
jgi:uncharacterized membrane protein